ncbi:MAG TPA: hypothetical protein VHO06_09450 [Polyangia bacterium]|nr:hypothetical protein [Polyangia bacterium]
MKIIAVERSPVSIAVWALGALFVGLSARPAAAADPPAPAAPEATAVSSEAAAAGAAPASPPPYSLPWQLRPVAASTAIRSDSSVALYDSNGASGSSVVTILTGSYQETRHLAPLAKLAFVENAALGTTPSISSFVDPIVGLTYARRVGALRWAAFAGAAVPIGQGSGDHPDKGVAAANKAAVAARSGMDNSMFAVNYFTAVAGGDLAYVDRKLTVQAEATLFESLRVHGDSAGAASTDAARTNSTMGLHLGYFVIPALSLGAELRYQRYLSTPTQLNATGMKVNLPDANLDTATVAIGPRGNFAIGRATFIRPGISYARVLDQPLASQSYNIVQVDVPVVF